MLIHLAPRYFLNYSNVTVELLDLFLPELNMTLVSGKDITIRTPYPNKCYKVICRKKGRKAINGIFIETDKIIENFTAITRWAVNGEVSTHTVHFHLEDSDFDAVTECQLLWNGFHNTPFTSRKSNLQNEWIPAKDQPRMLLDTDTANQLDGMRESHYSLVDNNDIIRSRVEYYAVPTVERERLSVPSWFNDRLPALDDCFSATVLDYGMTIIPTASASFCGVESVSLTDWIKELRQEFGERSYDKIHSDFFKILDEIKEISPCFFSNTNDLINKVKSFSKIYLNYNGDELAYLNDLLVGPVFHVTLIEGE